MKYSLYYKEHAIASVEQNDADFPTFFGHYELTPTINAPALAHVRAYIDYSVRVSPLMEQDRFGEIDLAEEKTFTDLIESSDWFLVDDKTKERTPILIPIFFTNNAINWRLNPDVKHPSLS